MIGSTAKRVHFGNSLDELEKIKDWDEALVCTMQEPWAVVESSVRGAPKRIHRVTGTSIEHLRSLEVPPGTRRIVGIGGGTPIDAAKYLGWSCDLPVTAIPTIASVDAMVTPAVAVRTRSIVKYVASCAPEEVIVLFPIIQKAPARLSRAGLCDILSCHTAQFDWKLAEARGQDIRDVSIAQSAQAVLDECVRNLTAIRDVTPQGVHSLISAFCTINDLTLSWGSARMEEGSEHFFAYAMEHHTQRHFVHGELVALGILLMSILQDNNPEWVWHVLTEAGLNCHPQTLEISDDELYSVLKSLKEFVRDNRLWYSVIDDQDIDEQRLVEQLYGLIGRRN